MGPSGRRAPAERLPPGQWLTEDWPILHHGDVPHPDLATWAFTAEGLVTDLQRWSFADFRALGAVTVRADMHCVTTWSKYDNDWTGIPVRRVLDACRPLPEARFVVVHCFGGYATNLTLAEFAAEENLFAWAHAPEPLSAEHGGPLRLVVPKLYAWKSAKWVCGIELRRDDQRGFWEERGYHNHADPFLEERYSYQED